MYQLLQLFTICCFFINVKSYTLPDNVRPCKRQDSACLTKLTNLMYKSAVVGDPAMGFESSDPMYQKLIEGDLPIVKYKLFNTTVTGFNMCSITSASLAPDSPKLHIKMYCPKLNMVGDYTIDGRLITVPIQGEGPYNLECRGYDVTIDSDIKVTTGKDNKRHWSIKQFIIEADLRDGMDMNLENLFNGRKDLAEPVNRFIKENWKETVTLLQGPAFISNFKILVKNFNKFIKTIPIDNFIES